METVSGIENEKSHEENGITGEPVPVKSYAASVIQDVEAVQDRVRRAITHYTEQRREIEARFTETVSDIDANIRALSDVLNPKTSQLATKASRAATTAPLKKNSVAARIAAALKARGTTMAVADLAREIGAPNSSVNTEARRRDTQFQVFHNNGRVMVALR